MNKSLFALIDCNNFFVSCERIFRPDLEGKPVVVMSSNDGVVIARSDEAKAIGIPMGAPVFKYRQLFERHKVVKFSANFELYGNISRRITSVLKTITPRIEIYSVDESFLDLSHLNIKDYEAWGRIVREKISNWVGVPVSIGIASTKTLAKLASERAKKDPSLQGVLDLTVQGRSLYIHLREVPVQDVWGVGWRLAPKLRGEGISNALRLAQLSPRHAQQLMGIHGRQMVAELNGTSCYPIELLSKARQSIARTRTFGEDTNDFAALEAAIASFVSQAAYRLRADDLLTRKVGLFLTTNRNKPGYNIWNSELKLEQPTADTGLLTSHLVAQLNKLYKYGIFYHRAGVWLYDFIPSNTLQTDLLGFTNLTHHRRSTARMQAVDELNGRFGKGKIYYAAEGLGKTWQPKHHLISPRYVSNWKELPTARIN